MVIGSLFKSLVTINNGLLKLLLSKILSNILMKLFTMINIKIKSTEDRMNGLCLYKYFGG